ncbi:MAG: hypothetical protein JXL20_07905 [Deltaproteobacteria bacterium]|nr:hypothetical protein [Deltaproteobacteria bacterium]
MSKTNKGEFNNEGEALEKIGQDFNDWCFILTSHSLQAAYAIIAANWAVHGTAQEILGNWFSKWSMVFVFLFIGVNLLATRWMICMHYRQFLYAEEDPARWAKEFQESRGKRSFWPYTKKIEYLGIMLRGIKTWAPVLAALLFVLSLFYD